jgi:N-acetylmuramoyl-L-alanine amidase
VEDVQRRLAALGIDTSPDAKGIFGPGTRAAIEAFQHTRGLRIDGQCGNQTWSALVEAGFRLGDRLLYHCRPMLRGDDIADLQRRLSALGFDTGRVDGIFGAMTAGALADFQRNTDLPPDGICGSRTLRELLRVMPRYSEPELVSAVRDRERMRRSPTTLLGRRIALGEEGGLDAVVTAVRRRLASAGAQVVPILHSDGSAQAALANAASVEVYLGIRFEPQRTDCQAAYYTGYHYESPGGRRLANLVCFHTLKNLRITGATAVGMSLPILRETRMPAVVCEIGPSHTVVEKGAHLAEALADALIEWATTPFE